MKTHKPRQGNYIGMPIQNIEFSDGTWLEGEEFCYPSGGMLRRAYAKCADGKTYVFRAGIQDTYFSIPARRKGMKGFLSIKGEGDSQGLVFTQQR